jgi:fructokinase
VTRRLRAVGIGEILWDLLPGGERLGGAPFNVVAHLHRFGWDAAFVTAVGNDPRGHEALERARRLGVDTSWIAVSDLPTGVVNVAIDDNGVPDFEIVSPAAYEAVEPWSDEGVPGGFDLQVFGTLAQQFEGTRTATRQLADRSPDAIRLYDVNLRRDRWDIRLVAELLDLATVVKLNDSEARALAACLGLPVEPIEAFARAAARRFGLHAICVTRGADGAGLLLDGEYHEAPAPAVEVIDTVGAGDAFGAALGHGLAMGWPAADILIVANRLGSLVASGEGAILEWKPSDVIDHD